jgi:hypothetical protein
LLLFFQKKKILLFLKKKKQKDFYSLRCARRGLLRVRLGRFRPHGFFWLREAAAPSMQSETLFRTPSSPTMECMNVQLFP